MSDLYGSLVRLPAIAAEHILPRHVDVLLPPNFDGSGETRYPVLYMHDGQNLFRPDSSFSGVDWGIDAALYELQLKVIVVGIWNTEQRWPDYMPNAAVNSPSSREEFKQQAGGNPLSDAYLDWMVAKLKPYIDANYPTRSDRDHTCIMGSSMGGLISLYAVCQYPEIFGGAGCLSTHWVAGDGCVVEYMSHFLPRPGQHRWYFDHGTEGLDAEYAPLQQKVDRIMRDRGYREGTDWLTKVFPGADHSEADWRARVHLPLEFLFEGALL